MQSAKLLLQVPLLQVYWRCTSRGLVEYCHPGSQRTCKVLPSEKDTCSGCWMWVRPFVDTLHGSPPPEISVAEGKREIKFKCGVLMFTLTFLV